MTLEEAREAYINKFGGYPYFLLMGADEAEELSIITKCVKSGKEMQAPDYDADF